MIKQSQRATTKRQRSLSVGESDEVPEKMPRYQGWDTQDQAIASFNPSSQDTAQESDIGSVLSDHFKTLKEEMEPLEVAYRMKKKQILDASSHETIVNQKSRRMRVDAFIKALYKAMHRKSGSCDVYKELMSALTQTGQQGIVLTLQTSPKPYQPKQYESQTLLEMFMKKKNVILNEIEPLDVIDDIVEFRGLHLQDHEEIIQANSRKCRVKLLCKHLDSLPQDQAWMILKPIKDKYTGLLSDSSENDKSSDTSVLSNASSGSSSTDLSSKLEGPSTELRINFLQKGKNSTVVEDSNEHDHPSMKLRQIKEIEQKLVEDANNDPAKREAIEKEMKECTLLFKSLKFSSIRISLLASSDISVQKLEEFCQDGRANSLILGLLDTESKEKLKELESTIASLDIYVDKEKTFLDILDEVGEGCLCTLTSRSITSHFDYIVEKIDDLDIPFIDKVLENGRLDQDSSKELLKIKECAFGKERRRKLLQFLQQKNTSQTLLCILENDILMSDAEIILRIQQTKPCRVLADSGHDFSREAKVITASDLHEHAEILEDEIDPRWFLSSLQSRTDKRSTEIVKTIKDSKSRKERSMPFLKYLYDEENLQWFADGLAISNKHILHQLQFHKCQEKVHTQDLKFAFLSAFDDITKDLEPLQLAKYFGSSFLQQTDFASLRDINTRQGRASYFIRKILSGSDHMLGETLEAMRCSYSDLVSTVEDILKCGSVCEKYKCPRIRRWQGNSPVCVFRTNIPLFDEDSNKRTEETYEVYSPERKLKNMLATGFVQAKVLKYEKGKPWTLSGRLNTCIGVIGSETPCKRSLLKAMSERIVTNVETAKIHVETDVKKFSAYKEAKNVIFWDLPEVGTDHFPRETYLTDIAFKRYDCFAMLVKDQNISDDYILLAKEIVNLHRKVVLICTNKGSPKVPSTKYEPIAHCSSAENVKEKQAVDKFRQTCYKRLQELGCNKTPFFLIKEDAILNNNYDFDKLFAKLIEEVSNEKHNT
ncbi:uncharacterized protein LOC123536077 isoform X1 [Mercenaria mercenaria]|uniref:uncharacterized protein LOC123536077 isoform X1 n=1 Tax=Mercenaria mercenaria TaxID=6596 RepID=UPI00234E9C25|nr:uncharacterized protein LOC123536077 isoform X1 [Mercenaria mercenaria]